METLLEALQEGRLFGSRKTIKIMPCSFWLTS